MVRTILIGENEQVLRKRKLWIAKQASYQLIGSYATSLEAIQKVTWNEIDAVHIETTDLHWTVISEMLLKMNPMLEIVFFKSDFGEDAYLVKSISMRELNLIGRKPQQPESQTENGIQELELHICCFGGLSFCYHQEPIFFPTQKSEEIIAFLVNHGKEPVMRDVIIEALWPDMDAEKGINNFHVNIHNIRKVLKKINLPNLLLQSKGSYYLDRRFVFCDVWEFSEVLCALKRVQFESKELLERASDIYSGQYLGTNDYSWSSHHQYQYERDFEMIQSSLYDICMREGSYKKAAQVAKSLIHSNPLSADAYEKCINALVKSGNEDAALKCLKDMEKVYEWDLNEPLPLHLQNVKKALSTAKYRNKAFLYEALSG